jgi:hypothetical protein
MKPNHFIALFYVFSSFGTCQKQAIGILAQVYYFTGCSIQNISAVLDAVAEDRKTNCFEVSRFLKYIITL